MAGECLHIYKCDICGNVVEVVHWGAGQLACCGHPMQLLTENTAHDHPEKHLPVIEKVEGGVNVKVGAVAHSMKQTHFIEWIEAIVDGKAYRQFLNPGETPEAFFPLEGERIVARELCNLHGLWTSQTN